MLPCHMTLCKIGLKLKQVLVLLDHALIPHTGHMLYPQDSVVKCFTHFLHQGNGPQKGLGTLEVSTLSMLTFVGGPVGAGGGCRLGRRDGTGLRGLPKGRGLPITAGRLRGRGSRHKGRRRRLHQHMNLVHDQPHGLPLPLQHWLQRLLQGVKGFLGILSDGRC